MSGNVFQPALSSEAHAKLATYRLLTRNTAASPVKPCLLSARFRKVSIASDGLQVSLAKDKSIYDQRLQHSREVILNGIEKIQHSRNSSE